MSRKKRPQPRSADTSPTPSATPPGKTIGSLPDAPGVAPPTWQSAEPADPPPQRRAAMLVTGALVLAWLGFLLFAALRG